VSEEVFVFAEYSIFFAPKVQSPKSKNEKRPESKNPNKYKFART